MPTQSAECARVVSIQVKLGYVPQEEQKAWKSGRVAAQRGEPSPDVPRVGTEAARTPCLLLEATLRPLSLFPGSGGTEI